MQKHSLFPPSELVNEPLEQASTIPSAWYTDQRYHDVDLRFVYHHNWQYIGPAEHVGKTGDFITGIASGDPVILTRDEAGRLKAYYNVCKHRGGPLETEFCGHIRMLQCKYHGWTYKLDGSLRGVPRFERTDLFDKADFGLTPLRADIWQGMVFVNPGGSAAPLETIFHGIEETISPLQPGKLAYSNRMSYDVKCNWKVYVDNYLEGYHLPLVHPELCDALSYADYETETFDHYSLQHAPFQEDASDRAYYYFIFPNTMFNILPGRLQINAIVPVSTEMTRVIFDYYYSDISSPAAKKLIEDDQEFADRVQWEDIEICEHVQHGLRSVAYDKGRFSVDTEAGVHHFQQLLKREYQRFVHMSRQI
ncbi:MAG: Rieske 2Fe-2S domain-containing protein [Rhodothermales bacterium]|nr:Rieske 2Fe-2S domain-containing protein [Rhodothermales bacterium]